MVTEAAIQAKVKEVLERFKTTPILYHPYVSGPVDIYGQRTKTYGTPVTLVGRAIHRPTPEVVSVIGDAEEYEIAFLFSRLELREKFPTSEEGEWISKYGEIEWRSRRYKIERVAPSGQVGETFSLVIVMGNTIRGQRDT